LTYLSRLYTIKLRLIKHSAIVLLLLILIKSIVQTKNIFFPVNSQNLPNHHKVSRGEKHGLVPTSRNKKQET